MNKQTLQDPAYITPCLHYIVYIILHLLTTRVSEGMHVDEAST